MTQLLGMLGAGLTTGAWLPQLLRCWRRRSAGDLSWAYLTTTTLGVALWLVYGLSTGDPVVIGANVVTLGLVLAVCSSKTWTDRATETSGVQR